MWGMQDTPRAVPMSIVYMLNEVLNIDSVSILLLHPLHTKHYGTEFLYGLQEFFALFHCASFSVSSSLVWACPLVGGH